MKINLNKSFTTHMGVLIKVLFESKGNVLELGTGAASTPLLHWLCKDMNRRLISFENDPYFYKWARQYQSRLHRIRFVTNWDDVDAKDHWGVVLVDHSPAERRATDIIRFKESVDYIVIHDTESETHYGYQQVWPHFKHIYTWKECKPWVSVVSNFKDLSNL